jgi:predicted HNH restriction endonuclease
VCRAAARHVHHIIAVELTGIAAELALEPANMLVLCNDCHALMHPGSRNRNMWWHMSDVSRSRGRALAGRGHR